MLRATLTQRWVEVAALVIVCVALWVQQRTRAEP